MSDKPKKTPSPIIGRVVCHVCHFASAHVKQSEKCIYTYCPDCGSQVHHKTERQQDLIKAKMRKEGEKFAPTGTGTPTDTPTPTPTPTRSEDEKPTTGTGMPTDKPNDTTKPAPAPVAVTAPLAVAKPVEKTKPKHASFWPASLGGAA